MHQTNNCQPNQLQHDPVRERLEKSEYSKPQEGGLTVSDLSDSPLTPLTSLPTSNSPLTRADFFANVLRIAENTPLPPAAEDIIHPSIRQLLRICIVLANNAMRMQGPGKPFYLSSYVAADLLGTTQQRTHQFLMMLCKGGFIEKVKRGGEKTANRYRLLAF